MGLSADKGHSPFPSSERAVSGFALWLASFLLLGEVIWQTVDMMRAQNRHPLFSARFIPCRSVRGVGFSARLVVAGSRPLLPPSEVSTLSSPQI